MAKRKNTVTSTFGSPGREGHDSSAFYQTRLYADRIQVADEAYVENPIAELDVIHHASCEEMKELPDCSVHLMVTSPPYNVGKEYDNNLTLEEYLSFLKKVWKETYRVLVPGGRACINIANVGRKPYIPLSDSITQSMIDLGFLMRGEIIWDKAASASTSTAWGSWQSATNPTLRDTHEYILVFSKGSYRREKMDGRKSTISKDEFLEFTKSVWGFPSELAKKVGHPAPFPVELPYRLIQLYTFSDEVVLDPFIGSGQTAIAALKAGRHFIGYEISEEYIGLAEKRIWNGRGK
ncbi:MAG TPA: site-specific DNA-methyltransferase [Anaerolineales bacterium]|jgi:site-specific DNA-methyltransferase (adenine-specific)|nr:site-specific DNA-methyltransferase [Anaerolineales bacterium]